LFFIVLNCDFSGIIFSANLSDPKPGQIVYKADHVIDDLVIDPERAHLYWAAYDAGFIARLDITGGSNTTHDVIVSSLTSPRALVIDVINRCVTSLMTPGHCVAVVTYLSLIAILSEILDLFCDSFSIVFFAIVALSSSELSNWLTNNNLTSGIFLSHSV